MSARTPKVEHQDGAPANRGDPVILVFHQGAIGDFLLTLPVIQAAREAAGAARVEVVASASSARVAAGRSVVDTWTSPEQVGLHTLFGEGSDLDEGLVRRLEQASLVLSFLGGPAEASHHRLCAATPGRVVSVDPRPNQETLAAGRHITAQWVAAVRAQALAIGSAKPTFIRMEKTPAGSSPDSPVIGDTGESSAARVVIHPGSGGRGKCWPVERFMVMADEMDGVAIAWMLGPAECEAGDDRFAGLRDRIQRRGEKLIIEADLLVAAREIAEADLFAGNDSGMTHLAAALGVRTLAVFTTTDPRVWRPLGDHVTVLASR
ncbi:MAG: glycosyltransferase family 9 protein [Phycisphaerae bacterium]|nr:glycosyltransferase family 9 protein [Phycisphaerae bacterium]